MFGSSHLELHRRAAQIFVKISEKSTCQIVHFGNVTCYMTAALQKDKLFSQAFFKDLAYRFSFQNYGTAILEDNF